MLHEELTDKIIGAAIAVHRAIGPGLQEKSYQAAMALELNAVGLAFEQKRLIAIAYRGEIVGHHIRASSESYGDCSVARRLRGPCEDR